MTGPELCPASLPNRSQEKHRTPLAHATVNENQTELYKIQIDAGRYYLHEHPLTASSWQEPCLRKIINHEHNFTTRIHMCAYGMKIPDKMGNEINPLNL